MFEYDIFVSYSSNDRNRALALAQGLRDAGLRVWLDDWVIKLGDDIYLKVEAGLESSRTLLMCVTATALASDWVQMERSSTLFRDPHNRGRSFVPVLLEDCELPQPLLRYKHFDLRNGDHETLQRLVEELQRLLAGDDTKAGGAGSGSAGPDQRRTHTQPLVAEAAPTFLSGLSNQTVLHDCDMALITLCDSPSEGKVVWKQLRALPAECQTMLQGDDYAIILGSRLLGTHTAASCVDSVLLRYVPGHSLADVVTTGNVVRGALLDDIVVAVLHQLRAAHRLGIVHRDVTPANIVLGIVPEPQRPERGRVEVHLIDFESACYASHAQTACGVFGYTPDEQMRGRAVPASDLFALLSSALFFATGKRPNATRWNEQERQRAAKSIEWGNFTELEVIGHPFFTRSWLDGPEQRPRDAATLLDRQDHRTKHYPPDTSLGVFVMPDGWRISMYKRQYIAERSP